MKKNNKIIVVISIAVIASIIAGVLTFLFLSPSKTLVYAFKDDYSAGTKVTSDILVSMEVDSSIVIAGNKSSASNYFITTDEYQSVIQSGDSLKQDVYKGSLLTSSVLTTEGGTAIEKRMNPTSIAVSIPVDNITGVTYDLDVDSYCNLFVTYSSGSTYTLLEDMRVISVAKDGSNLSSVTFEATKDQAEKIIDAVNTGTIRLGLINHENYNNTNTSSSKSNSKSSSSDSSSNSSDSSNTSDKYNPDNYTASTESKD
jgi:Flp pilus assembly protein CpaB